LQEEKGRGGHTYWILVASNGPGQELATWSRAAAAAVGSRPVVATVTSTDQRSERGDGPSGLWAVGHGVKEALLEARRAWSWCNQVGAVGHEMTGPVCAPYSWHLLLGKTA
jgi:phage terminase large subunit-like protein